jgi:hypothetical protein
MRTSINIQVTGFLILVTGSPGFVSGTCDLRTAFIIPVTEFFVRVITSSDMVRKTGGIRTGFIIPVDELLITVNEIRRLKKRRNEEVPARLLLSRAVVKNIFSKKVCTHPNLLRTITQEEKIANNKVQITKLKFQNFTPLNIQLPISTPTSLSLSHLSTVN